MTTQSNLCPFRFSPGDHVYARVSPGRQLLANALGLKDQGLTVIESYRNDYGFPIYRLWHSRLGEIELAQLCLSFDRIQR